MCTLLFASPALAGEDPLHPEASAEYVRLSEELAKLAKRNAWAGVERTYKEIIALGVEPTASDHISAAHAARSMGNLTAARDRLNRAHELAENKEVIDWLWQIDQNYGSVFVAADPNKKIKLDREVMPFNPEERQAVEFAQMQVEETGLFNGLLPAGTYTFGPHEIDVVPRVQSVRIDMRTQTSSEDRNKRKSHKKGDRPDDH